MRSPRLSWTLGCLMATGLVLPGGPRAAEESPVVSLKDSLAPVQELFNQWQGQPRFVALLSPT